jgi:DNA-binding response OmpR family regulator
MKILIIEDDPHILLGLRDTLESEGFTVATCARGDAAVAAVQEQSPDLVVLDVMLPGVSGYDICKELRTRKIQVPILMLTAKGQEIDKVIGLELGADDYVTKPFGIRELVARVNALLRRSRTTTAKAGNTSSSAATAASQGHPGSQAEGQFTIGTVVIDSKRFQLRRGDSHLESLTAKELKLLQIFYAHPGEVLSRDQLLNEVWGYNYFGTTRTLDQTIVQLRKKLGDNGGEPKHIFTVHGVGYRLVL